VLLIPRGPLASLVVAMNVLAGLTGTASGGMAIALNALGDSFMRLAAEHGIDPALRHRLTTISTGTLDALPHNGTVLLLLQISKLTHREKLFSHGDDCDRRCDHLTFGGHCAWFDVWIVLIDSRSASGTAARLARQVREPIMTPPGCGICPTEQSRQQVALSGQGPIGSLPDRNQVLPDTQAAPSHSMVIGGEGMLEKGLFDQVVQRCCWAPSPSSASTTRPSIRARATTEGMELCVTRV
jgi:hypothetical protein